MGSYNATQPTSLKAFIYNPGSSSVVKMVYNLWYGLLNIKTGGVQQFQAWWNGDTNPLTGIEIVSGGGNLKAGATCSLYGMN